MTMPTTCLDHEMVWQKQISGAETHTVFMYCYGHALNLVCQDSVNARLLKIHLKLLKNYKFYTKLEGILTLLKKDFIIYSLSYTMKSESRVSLQYNFKLFSSATYF